MLLLLPRMPMAQPSGPTLALGWSPHFYPAASPILLPFQPFRFYVLALEPPGGLTAYEFSVQLPPGLITTARTVYPSPGSLDVGTGDDNFIVGTGGICLQGALVPLVRYDVLAFGFGPLAPGSQVALGPATPTTFSPPSPGYLTCGSPGDLSPFVVAPPLALSDPGVPGVVIDAFVAQPSRIVAGRSATLQWATSHADAVSIEPGAIQGLPADGSLEVSPTGSTTWMLTAINAGGLVSASATVEVEPFAIVAFHADPDTVMAQEGVILSWEVLGDAEVEIDSIGSQPLVGQLVVYPTASRAYVLRARNAELVQERAVFVAVGDESLSGNFLGLSWSPVEYPGHEPAIAPYQYVDFYVLALAPAAGMQGYELSVDINGCFLAERPQYLHPVASDAGAGDDNFIVRTGAMCLQGALVPMLHYRVMAMYSYCIAGNELARLGPAIPSSFLPPAPGYESCAATGDLRRIRLGPPLRMSGDGGGGEIPAITLEVEARPVGSSILVSWRSDEPGDIRGVSILRRVVPPDVNPRRVVPIPGPVIHRLEGDAASASGEWFDAGIDPGVTYAYAVTLSGAWGAMTSVESRASIPLPATTRLIGVFPNPFNPRTEIRFELARPGDAQLSVFDVAGRLVRSVRLPSLAAGPHAWTWEGTDASGHGVSSGVYRVRLQGGGASDVSSVTLAR